MDVKALIALVLLSAPAFANDDLSAIQAEIREARIAVDGLRAIASYALEDYAKAKGAIDGCQISMIEPDFSAMAGRYGDWAKAGFWNWLSGEQGAEAERLLQSVKMGYSVAKLRPDCSALALHVLVASSEGYLRIFDTALSKSAD